MPVGIRVLGLRGRRKWVASIFVAVRNAACAWWRMAKPGIDYHIAVGRRFYSVPHNLIGQAPARSG
jgi:hypothetical protein